MAPEKILITGVNGFIGGHLANKLSSSKYEIHGLGRSLTTSSKNFSYYCCDLIDASLTKKVIEKVQPSVIIHLAGLRLRSEKISEFGMTLIVGGILRKYKMQGLFSVTGMHV